MLEIFFKVFICNIILQRFFKSQYIKHFTMKIIKPILFLILLAISFSVNSLAANTSYSITQSNSSSYVMAGIGGDDATQAAEDTASNINWLIIGIVVLLIVIISLIFDILTKVGEIQKKPVLNWNKINSKLLFILGVAGLLAVVWEFNKHAPLTINAQPHASAHSAEYEKMFMITLVLTGIVFFITEFLLFWYPFRYKHSDKRKALFFPDNHKLEYIWTIIPAIVLTVLVIRGLISWNRIMSPSTEKSTNIELFAYQFAWNARYSGADNKLGTYDFRKMDVVNPLGVDTIESNKAAFDDIVTNELHLKKDQPVYMHFRSKDVIHSAFLPHFRVQLNVVPGLPTKFAFTPTITTNEMRVKMNDPKFEYILLCNKICGSAHYRMKMKVIVDSPEDFEKWIKTQPALTAKGTEANMAFDWSKEIIKELASK